MIKYTVLCDGKDIRPNVTIPPFGTLDEYVGWTAARAVEQGNPLSAYTIQATETTEYKIMSVKSYKAKKI